MDLIAGPGWANSRLLRSIAESEWANYLTFHRLIQQNGDEADLVASGEEFGEVCFLVAKD